MIKLEETFVSGDGGFSSEPQTYTQLKRTNKAAIYQVSRNNKIRGFEVFLIKIRPKGTQTFQKTAEDDEEKYPSTGTFGKSAWFTSTLDRAEARFKELMGEVVIEEIDTPKEPSVKQAIAVPSIGEFTVNDYADQHGMTYANAYLLIKEKLADGSIVFLREERRNLKGKLSKVYQNKKS